MRARHAFVATTLGASLRDYLTLAHKNKDQKQAACAAFLSGYSDLAEADYPHIKHVRRALKALQRGQKAKVPSLSDVKIVPTGSPSANPTPTP